MNIDFSQNEAFNNLRNFVKDLFTLRTVWIDKGRGKWAVKKRLHPLLRGILCTFGIILCALVYAGLQNPKIVDAQPQPVTVTAKLPEPENLPVNEAPEPAAELVPEEVKQESAPPVQTEQHIIIPLTTRKTAQSSIILPSEMNPETDRIIAPVTKPAVPVNNGKYNIRISKSEYTLSLFKGNELVKTYRVAVGKNPGDKQRRGDNRTPVGDFKIVSIENASKWSHDFRDGKGKIAGAYGPWFLRLDAKGWKGIGIHGTHDPDSRGTNATEGCIRLSNEEITELKQYAYRGMPVVISEN